MLLSKKLREFVHIRRDVDFFIFQEQRKRKGTRGDAAKMGIDIQDTKCMQKNTNHTGGSFSRPGAKHVLGLTGRSLM